LTNSSLMMIASSKLNPSQVALIGGRAVGDHLALLDLVADLHDRLLVLAGPLVETDELPQLVDLRTDLDPLGVDIGNGPLVPGANDHAGVERHVAFQAGPHDRRLGNQQRHRLPLHVRAHQGPVRVVVLQERNQTGRDADHLARCHVDVFDSVDRYEDEVGVLAGDERFALDLAVENRGVGRGDDRAGLFVRAEPHHLVGQFAVFHFPVRRDQEAVRVDRGVHGQA
jgi:hypothetical protein